MVIIRVVATPDRNGAICGGGEEKDVGRMREVEKGHSSYLGCVGRDCT